MLTEQQHNAHQFICQFIEQHGYAPTIAEIAKGLGKSSRSYIHRVVQALERAKVIELLPKRRRNIVLVQPNHEQAQASSLPLLGRIAAGQPIEAVADQQRINLAQLFGGENRYLLTVKGDSMMGDSIRDGDWVVCQYTQTATDGDIVVALVDGEETTLKRFYRRDAKEICLSPSNPEYSDMIYDASRVAIQGVYLGLVRVGK